MGLDAANADLKKRQDLLKKSSDSINGLFDSINKNMATMSITIPEDKKKILAKEIKAVQEKLEVTGRFTSTVKTIVDLVANLTAFDASLKTMMHGRMLPQLSSKTSRRPLELCSLRTELQEQWISRKTLLLSLKSSRNVPQLKKHCCPKVIRFLLMLRSSKVSLTGLPSLSLNSRQTPRLSVTNTPMMSSSGLSTELELRNSTHG